MPILPSVRTNRIHHAMSLLSAATLSVVLTSCAPSPAADWAGDETLSDTPVTVTDYTATAALPDLTPVQAARAAGLRRPKQVTETGATGDGWQVTVGQSPYATSVRTMRECGEPITDPDVATKEAGDFIDRLGIAQETYHWFTMPGDDSEGVRVLAEPLIDGVHSWATGSLVVNLDAEGVCATAATLMAFEDTGETSGWVSAKEAFVAAEAGTYRRAEQSYTLSTGGRLTPFWRFTGDDGSVVVVDLGDGLESAPDTETYLRGTIVD